MLPEDTFLPKYLAQRRAIMAKIMESSAIFSTLSYWNVILTVYRKSLSKLQHAWSGMLRKLHKLAQLPRKTKIAPDVEPLILRKEATQS